MKKFPFIVVILAVATVMFFAFAARAEEPVKKEVVKKSVPVLSDAQKLSIREAQVRILVAAEQLHATPQWNQFQQAQSDLQAAIAKVQTAIGEEYSIDGNLVITKKEAKK